MHKRFEIKELSIHSTFWKVLSDLSAHSQMIFHRKIQILILLETFLNAHCLQNSWNDHCHWWLTPCLHLGLLVTHLGKGISFPLRAIFNFSFIWQFLCYFNTCCNSLYFLFSSFDKHLWPIFCVAWLLSLSLNTLAYKFLVNKIKPWVSIYALETKVQKVKIKSILYILKNLHIQI